MSYCRADTADGVGFIARIPHLLVVAPLLFTHERLDTKAPHQAVKGLYFPTG
jgi:hypothetical protein